MAIFDFLTRARSTAAQGKPDLGDVAQRLAELESRVDSLDQRTLRLEEQAQSTLEHFGGYKDRTEGELKLMRDQIDDLVAATEALAQQSEDRDDVMRARRLLRRLKNNRTRIQRALASYISPR